MEKGACAVKSLSPERLFEITTLTLVVFGAKNVAWLSDLESYGDFTKERICVKVLPWHCQPLATGVDWQNAKKFSKKLLSAIRNDFTIFQIKQPKKVI